MIKEKIQLLLFKKKWRKRNSHNTTWVKNVFDPNLVSVGKYSYGGLQVIMHNPINRLVIGDYCSIAGDIIFVLSADHYTDRIFTFPLRVKCLNEKQEGVSKGDIIVGDDVWIGYRAMILSGVNIGQGAIIAAGAVVTKDVPPYAIVGGVPASVIRYRFQPEIIEELVKLDLTKIDLHMIKENIDAFYTKVEKLKDLSWLRYKDDNC